MELRPTTAEDLPTLHALFLDSIGGVYRPHAFEPPAPPFEVFAAQQRHVLATGRSVVAERDGKIVGFAAAWARGADWFLASLFVEPDAQAVGLGTILLDGVWDAAAARRRTITDAIQPVSNALYGRRGLIPVTPLLAFAGQAAGASVTLEPLDGAEAALPSIDVAAYGFDRAVDHAYWAESGLRTIWGRDGEPIAYTYLLPGGAIGPVAGLSAEAAAGALESCVRQTSGPVTVRMPGSARPLVAAALRLGLRLSPTPGLLLCSAGAEPPTALAVGSFSLF